MFKNGLVVEMAKLIVLKAPWNLILHLMAKTARLSLLFVGDTPGTVASLIFILLITSPCWLVGCIFLQFTDLLRFSDPNVYWAQNHLFGCFYLQVGFSSFSLAIIVIPIAFSWEVEVLKDAEEAMPIGMEGWYWVPQNHLCE